MSIVLYKDVPVPITRKECHVRKIGGRRFFSFIKTVGNVPVAYYNSVTGKFEDVVNTRGNSYAARNRKSFRNKKKVK